MTERLFETDAYLTECAAAVVAHLDGAVVLDRTVFYPLGGGQPGDTGELIAADGSTWAITDTRKQDGEIAHCIKGEDPPPVGARVTARLDWDRRYAHMRMHTALHLLGVVIPHPVTGGNIGVAKSRLDFDMTDTVDKESVAEKLNSLIEADHPVETQWITGEELAAQPELIRTMSVKPPMDAARIRLLNIPDIDLQPCGGTHVKHTGEIGPMRLGKVEKKGKHNRRVAVVFAD